MYLFLLQDEVKYILDTYEERLALELKFLEDYDTVVEAPEGVFEVGETFDPSRLKTLEELKLEKKSEIDNKRLEREKAGMPWFEDDIVQLRNERDFLNILGLCSKAILLKEQVGAEAPLPFQAESNITRFLTPDEMLELGFAAMAHAQEGYQTAWELKRLVDSATSEEDLDAIHWPSYEGEVPTEKVAE